MLLSNNTTMGFRCKIYNLEHLLLYINNIHQLKISGSKITPRNRIAGVMASVFASSAVDRGFEPRSGQTKYYKIGICCFSAKHTERAKTGWLGIRIKCPSGATCLSADCCFNELALKKSKSACWSRTKGTSSSPH